MNWERMPGRKRISMGKRKWARQRGAEGTGKEESCEESETGFLI